MKNFLIVLLGPTGVGKTEISIDLAFQFGSEIISADSRQFFREMRIGTAVPSEIQLKTIRHHFIGFLSAKDYYSASIYERDVLKILPEIFSRNRIALLSGGSGMYIDAVCNGIDDIPDVDPDVRQKFLNKLKEEGIEGLRVALKLLDPVYYAKTDLRNQKRIIRALEICETTGRPYSSFLTGHKRERDFEIIKVGLNRPREELYARINQRVDLMIRNGLEEEAKSLCGLRHLNALNSVGYKEFFDFFEGKISREMAVELIKRNTRRFAKRQITWWGKDKEIRWFGAEDKDNLINYIKSCINVKSSPPWRG
jgi:tRNA dimethylallyltransferase